MSDRFVMRHGEIIDAASSDLTYHTGAAVALLNNFNLTIEKLKRQVYGLQRALDEVDQKLRAVQNKVDAAKRGELAKRP